MSVKGVGQQRLLIYNSNHSDSDEESNSIDNTQFDSKQYSDCLDNFSEGSDLLGDSGDYIDIDFNNENVVENPLNLKKVELLGKEASNSANQIFFPISINDLFNQPPLGCNVRPSIQKSGTSSVVRTSNRIQSQNINSQLTSFGQTQNIEFPSNSLVQKNIKLLPKKSLKNANPIQVKKAGALKRSYDNRLPEGKFFKIEQRNDFEMRCSGFFKGMFGQICGSRCDGMRYGNPLNLGNEWFCVGCHQWLQGRAIKELNQAKEVSEGSSSKALINRKILEILERFSNDLSLQARVSVGMQTGKDQSTQTQVPKLTDEGVVIKSISPLQRPLG